MPGVPLGCSTCDFETTDYDLAKKHEGDSRSLGQRLRDTAFTFAVLAVILGGPPALFIACLATSHPAQPIANSTSSGHHASGIDPADTCVGDCGDGGMPADVESSVRRDQQAQLAEDYCASSADQYEGDYDSCVQAVEDGDIEVDPVDVYGPPGPPPSDQGYPDLGSYP